MSRAYYPKPARPPRRPGLRRSGQSRSRRYLQAVFAKLKSRPELLGVVKRNYHHYLQQELLRRGSRKTLERFGWIIETADSVADFEKWVMEDSHIGAKFRAFPLLFKGVLDEREKEALLLGISPTDDDTATANSSSS